MLLQLNKDSEFFTMRQGRARRAGRTVENRHRTVVFTGRITRRGDSVAAECPALHRPGWNLLRFRNGVRQEPSRSLGFARDDSLCCHIERSTFRCAVETSQLSGASGSDKAEKEMSNRNRSRLLIHHRSLGHRSCSRSCLQLASGFRWSNRKPSMPQPRAASTLVGRSSMKSVSPGCRP